MQLVVAKQSDLLLEGIKDIVEEGAAESQVVYGFAKVLSGKEWVLVERDALAKGLAVKLKPTFNQEEVLKQGSPYRIARREDRLVLVAKEPKEPSISSREEFEKLMEQSGQDVRVAASYLLQSFSSLDSYSNSGVHKFVEAENSTKPEVVDKVMKQYYNKNFIGEQAFMVPKYYPETGNWDDKETTKLNLKQV